MRSVFLWQALAALLCLGCSGAPADEPTADPPGCEEQPATAPSARALELGHLMQGTLAPLSSDEALELHFGPQGGQHVYVDLLLYAPEERQWDLSVELTSADGELLGSNRRRLSACSRGNLVQNFFVFVSDPATPGGFLTAKAVSTNGDDSIASAPVQIRILRQ